MRRARGQDPRTSLFSPENHSALYWRDRRLRAYTSRFQSKLFLHGRRLRAFDRAWCKYYAYDETDTGFCESLVKYSPDHEGTTNEECRDLAIANIEHLLHFAKGWRRRLG